MSRNNSTKKYIFVLKGINPEKIDQRYNITIMSNIETTSENVPYTTKLSDLSYSKNNPTVVSFLDESKKTQKCSISMIDFLSGSNFFDKIYNCFWCRNPPLRNTTPIGCPIKYVPNQVIKTYYSEISKDEYTIRENVTALRFDNTGNTLNKLDRDYYQTDGVFCSFNCCMSYIIDNRNNSMYNMSEMLLLKMYNDIYTDKVPSISPAPHWRKLNQYGGDLSLEMFRDSFNKIDYKNHGIASSLPKFRSIAVLFEEKLKF